MPLQVQREAEVYHQPIRNLALEGGGWLAQLSRRLTQGKRPGIHCAGGWVGLGAGLDGTEYLASTGIRSLDRPARIASLYQLRYVGHQVRSKKY